MKKLVLFSSILVSGLMSNFALAAESCDVTTARQKAADYISASQVRAGNEPSVIMSFGVGNNLTHVTRVIFKYEQTDKTSKKKEVYLGWSDFDLSCDMTEMVSVMADQTVI